MDIQLGATVRTKFGEVGVVRSISNFNGSRYYRLQACARVGWGNGLHLTNGSYFVGEGEIVAVRKTATEAVETAAVAV